MKTLPNRFRQATWCPSCNKEIGRSNVCPDCGSSFLGGGIWLCAVIEEKFVPCKFKLFSPDTWDGGHWEIVSVRKH